MTQIGYGSDFGVTQILWDSLGQWEKRVKPFCSWVAAVTNLGTVKDSFGVTMKELGDVKLSWYCIVNGVQHGDGTLSFCQLFKLRFIAKFIELFSRRYSILFTWFSIHLREFLIMPKLELP